MNSPQLPSRIELWPVDRLKPYERNARTHDAAQVKKIAASITEFGFTNPILVDSSDGIIAGHGRLMAAKELGLSEVPVIVLDHLTDAQRRAYILADNRLALDAGWDNEMLAAELTALQADGFDLDLTGFSGEEIDDLLADGDDADQDRDDDAVPETAKRLVSRRGDVWLLGKHRLICGDSTNLSDIARLCELDEKFVDVIVRRWQDYTGKRATLEATGQSYDDVAAGGAAANDNFEGDDAVAV